MVLEYFNIDCVEKIPQENRAGNGQYVIRCPLCKDEHTKEKLYIKEDFSEAFCFLCNRIYINVTDEIDTSYEVPDIFSKMIIPGHLEMPVIEDPKWSLEKFQYEFSDSNPAGEKYLKSRHKYCLGLAKLLGFKYWGEHIAIPFMWEGKVIYYQIRFNGVSHDSGKIRYFFPKIKDGYKPPYIINHEVKENKLIIVEGVFDALAALIMAPSYIPVAVLGSSISDYQMGFLRDMVPSDIIVYMDETEISARVAERLKSVINYCPIHIIRSEGEDPEECLVKRIKQGRKLNWIDNVFSKDYRKQN